MLRLPHPTLLLAPAPSRLSAARKVIGPDAAVASTERGAGRNHRVFGDEYGRLAQAHPNALVSAPLENGLRLVEERAGADLKVLGVEAGKALVQLGVG